MIYNDVHRKEKYMRVSFRTTLEQELLEMLKKMAKEKNKNMNDIIEELLYFYYGNESQVTYFVPKMPDNYVGSINQFLKDEIAYISAKILFQNGIEVSEDFLKVLESVSTLMVDLAMRDKQLSEKISGKVSIEEIIENAEIIKKALDEKAEKEKE